MSLGRTGVKLLSEHRPQRGSALKLKCHRGSDSEEQSKKSRAAGHAPSLGQSFPQQRNADCGVGGTRTVRALSLDPTIGSGAWARSFFGFAFRSWFIDRDRSFCDQIVHLNVAPQSSPPLTTLAQLLPVGLPGVGWSVRAMIAWLIGRLDSATASDHIEQSPVRAEVTDRGPSETSVPEKGIDLQRVYP
jgi:hypothetical protein